MGVHMRAWNSEGISTGQGATNMIEASTDTPHTTVLIIDGDAIVRIDLRDLLETMGYRVIGEADDAQGAITMASRLHPDLVIMGVRLAGDMDGVDAAAVLTSKRVAPVLLLSHFGDARLVHRAAVAGAAAYVLMPFDEDSLRPAIEIALSRWRKIESLEQKVIDLTEELETRKVVELAKSVLMRQYALTEDEAFKRMTRVSAESHKTMRAVAEAIILAQGLSA